MNTGDVTVLHTNEVSPDHIRLYICEDCKQIIPLYSTSDAIVPPYKYDYLLHAVEAEHSGPRTEAEAKRTIRHWQGLPPLGRGHAAAVISVNKSAWEDERGQKIILDQIKDAIKNSNGNMLGDGYGAEFYAVKDQFKEDAMLCWKQHNKTLSCDDFKSPQKLLEPDTKAMRRSEGLADYHSNVHVCNFCPVASLVEQRLRAKKVDKGLY